MQITETRVDDLNMVLHVQVAPEDYREPVRKILNDYAKKANIPGFRKGKVPVSLIKKMYGKSVVFDELNKVLSSQLREHITSQQLDILGEPLPHKVDNIDLDPDGKVTYDFNYDVGLAPQFQLNLAFSQNPVRYTVEVDEETLDREIQFLRTRHGEISNPARSEEGDVLYGKVSEADESGNEIAGGLSRMGVLNPERIPDQAIIKEMAGKNEGDVFPIKMLQVFTNEDAVRHFWEHNVSGERVRDISGDELVQILGKNYVFEVKRINRVAKAEINQALFDKALGEGTVSTEAEFRTKYSEEIAKHFATQSAEEFRARLMRLIVDQNQIPLPDEFLRKFLLASREKLTPEMVEEMYESYARNLRWSLIINRIMRDNPDLKVGEEDIREAARQDLGQKYPELLTNAPEDRVNGYVDYFMQDQEYVRKTADALVEGRAMSHILGQISPADEVISAKKFMTLYAV